MNPLKNRILLSFFFLAACNNNSLEEKKVALKRDSEIKIQKVISQLKADCEANLLKETYKRVQQLQKSKQSRIVR